MLANTVISINSSSFVPSKLTDAQGKFDRWAGAVKNDG